MEELGPLGLAYGGVKWCSPYVRHYSIVNIVKHKITIYVPAIALLGICPRAMKAGTQTGKYTPVFTAALFTIIPKWKRPQLSSTDEWMWRMWYKMKYY